MIYTDTHLSFCRLDIRNHKVNIKCPAELLDANDVSDCLIKIPLICFRAKSPLAR